MWTLLRIHISFFIYLCFRHIYNILDPEFFHFRNKIWQFVLLYDWNSFWNKIRKFRIGWRVCWCELSNLLPLYLMSTNSFFYWPNIWFLLRTVDMKVWYSGEKFSIDFLPSLMSLYVTQVWLIFPLKCSGVWYNLFILSTFIAIFQRQSWLLHNDYMCFFCCCVLSNRNFTFHTASTSGRGWFLVCAQTTWDVNPDQVQYYKRMN